MCVCQVCVNRVVLGAEAVKMAALHQVLELLRINWVLAVKLFPYGQKVCEKHVGITHL